MSPYFSRRGAHRPRGEPRSRRPAFERLETRRALAADVSLRGTTVHVIGTDGPDDVDVTVVDYDNQRFVRVDANDVLHDFPIEGVRWLYGRLGEGDDRWMSWSVDITTLVFAGPGNDSLHGGGARDLLMGEAGNDAIIGGNGRDMLFGGAGDDSLSGDDGRDYLFGHDGNDVLIGGRDGDVFVGGRDGDILEAEDGELRDRLYGVEAIDHVRRDPAQPIPAREALDDRSNEIYFFAQKVEIRRYYPAGVDGIFYRIQLNDQLWGGEFYRAANKVHIRAYDVFIDDTIRAELEALGWLDIALVG